MYMYTYTYMYMRIYLRIGLAGKARDPLLFCKIG